MRMLSLLLAMPLMAQVAPQATPGMKWTDVRALTVEGQGWKEVKEPFDRLPAKAEGVVRKAVWDLSRHSAGIAVRFVTSSKTIHARWAVRNARLAMPHMPATGVSGLDLYVRTARGWRWVANGRPEKQENEQVLLRDWPGGQREYMLYLPLYNGVTKVEVGVPEGETVEAGPARGAGVKPVVFYGSSILQGGCASRPGMAYPAIIGRRLDWPAINQGYSGNGKSEPEMSALFAEIDAAAFVYDSLPNLTAEEARERVEPFLRALRKARPEMPLVLVENAVYADFEYSEQRRALITEKNRVLRAAYEKLRKAGERRVYYVRAEKLYGHDGEATVDGTHATDVGFMRMADEVGRVLRGVVKARR